MTAQPYTDYAVLADLKDELGLADTKYDGRLLRAISASSRLVDNICRQPVGGFVPQAAAKYFDITPDVAQRRFRTLQALDASVTDNTRGGASALSIPPCLTVEALRTDEDGDGVYEQVWTAGQDFLLEPYNDEVKRRISVNADRGRYSFPAGQRRLEIQGTWGITELGQTPLAITRATYILAGRYYRRPEALLALVGNAEVGFQRISQTDPDVATLLVTYGGNYSNQWIVA